MLSAIVIVVIAMSLIAGVSFLFKSLAAFDKQQLPPVDYTGKPVTAEIGKNVPHSNKSNLYEIVLGRETGSDKEIVYRGEGHILTIGPTRSGKGVGAVIPNLLRHRGSAIVIDPKAEALRATLQTRSSVGNVIVIDPWNISGQPCHHYNPLSISRNPEHIIEDASLIAESLIMPTGASDQVFWENEARSVISTIIMDLMLRKGSDLSALRVAIANGKNSVDEYFKLLAENEALDGRIARGAAQYLQKVAAEKSGVLSVCRQQTLFLDSPAVQSSLKEPSFQFSSLRAEPATVFICIPVWRLGTHGRLLRLLVSMALAELSRDTTKNPAPLLFIADEFAAIGNLAMFEAAFALMAGANVKMWAVLQDLSQLQKIFGDVSWQTMVANAGVLQCFGVRDLMTARYLSTRAGRTTIPLYERTLNLEDSKQVVSARYSERDALAVHELMQLPDHQGLVFVENHRPILFDKIRYFANE